jgi:hypothetical protein
MPFGKKLDVDRQTEIDFDHIYDDAIRPAADAANVDVVRADEEQHGGFIHLAMYERLLLAEIVLADLTLANPNVFYELGIRHAARPRSTVLMFGRVGRLPFDLAPIRAIPYEISDGRLTDSERLRNTLSERIAAAASAHDEIDSPLFQLVPKLPPLSLPHEVTESFRDRVHAIASVRERLQSATKEGEKGVDQIRTIERELGSLDRAAPESLLDVMLAYRSVGAWDEIVRLIDAFPKTVSENVTVREQLAMALNRSSLRRDRARAIELLAQIIEKHGPSPETNGVLGRVYKDMWLEAQEANDAIAAEGALAEAIKSYEQGFDADPRDYYPGVNAVTLSLQQPGADAVARIERLRPVVTFAVARRGGMNSQDYWVVATVLELECIGGDWPAARRAAGAAVSRNADAWMLDTTLKNLDIIRGWLSSRAMPVDALDDIVTSLRKRAESLRLGTR